MTVINNVWFLLHKKSNLPFILLLKRYSQKHLFPYLDDILFFTYIICPNQSLWNFNQCESLLLSHHRKRHCAVVYLLHQRLQIGDQSLHQEPGLLGHLCRPGVCSLWRGAGGQSSLLLVTPDDTHLQSRQVSPQALLLCHRAQFQRHRPGQVSQENTHLYYLGWKQVHLSKN